MAYPLKLLISAGILLFLLSRIDLMEAAREFAAVQPSYAAAAMALFFTTHAVNALKLGVLLPTRTARSLLAYTLVAQAYALLLPGQIAGEAVKAYRLSRGNGAGAGGIVSAVVFDKLIGSLAILLLTLGGLLAELWRFGNGPVWAIGAFLAVLLAAIAALASRRVQNLALALFDREGAGWRGWFGSRLSHFLEVWRTHATRPRTVALSLCYGLLAHLLTIGGSLLFGLGLGIDLSYATWCVVIGLLTVILLAPLTVGGIGLREISLVGILGHLGVAPDRALAMALAIFAFQIMVAALGIAVDLIVLRERQA